MDAGPQVGEGARFLRQFGTGRESADDEDQDDSEDPGDADDDVVEVLESNWTAVQVYMSCQWTLVGVGVGGVHWQGIAAAEVAGALQIHRVRRSDWLDVEARVRVMVQAARSLRNERDKPRERPRA